MAQWCSKNGLGDEATDLIVARICVRKGVMDNLGLEGDWPLIQHEVAVWLLARDWRMWLWSLWVSEMDKTLLLIGGWLFSERYYMDGMELMILGKGMNLPLYGTNSLVLSSWLWAIHMLESQWTIWLSPMMTMMLVTMDIWPVLTFGLDPIICIYHPTNTIDLS